MKQDVIETTLSGTEILNHPLYNKGSSFTLKERQELNLLGLLPSHVSTIEEQAKRMYEEIHKKNTPLEKFIALNALQNRNEVLFYRILYEHLVEFMPIVYTPTVGEACQEFSHIFRKVRGLWITPEYKGQVQQVLANYPHKDIRLIVVTDNERILGLGDLGAGGMGIPIGKLSLYTVAAGIHPSKTLAISLDVGTDNQSLLTDPLYLGWRRPRLRGQQYYDFVDEFISAVKKSYPNAILQWEDFKKQNAFTLVQKYRDVLPSFNDDIQGTAAVALAGILSACRISNLPFTSQRIVILGAGAAGIGISTLLKDRWLSEGVSEKDILERIILVDSKGLLWEGSEELDDHKKDFAWSKEQLQKHGLTAQSNLQEIVSKFKPTAILGISGQPGVFTKSIVEEIAKHTERPIIFPLSNPTSCSEAIPSDLLTWTNGKALIATGSPFDPVEYAGKTYSISQGNNVYIYPAIGLASVILKVKTIPNKMFASAAASLANMVSKDDLSRTQLYPSVANLRSISVHIAKDLLIEHGWSEQTATEKLENFVWTPAYPTFKKA